MQLTREQFEHIAPLLPRQRGNVRLENFKVVNAILYVTASGCKWRSLPNCYGHWHSVYMRMSRWAKAGVLNALAEQLQRLRLKHVPIKVLSLDSSIVKVHPDGTGAPKKNGPQAIRKSRGGWTTKLHLVAASARDVLVWSLTPGQAGDAPEGRQLIQAMGPQHPGQVVLLMDSAYQDNATRELARQLGFVPVVPPSPKRRQPWPLDKALYRRRNEVDIMFAAFITCALIAELLR